MGHSCLCDLTFNNETYVRNRDKLLKLTRLTDMSCVQRNGQRFFGPPPQWIGPPPLRGSEIFVTNIPKDCFEDEIVPAVASIGNVYEIRLMMNFSGFTRGYAFVTYCNPQEARLARLYLDGYEIRKGCRIFATKSIDNCMLYVQGIPMNKNKDDVLQEMQKIAPTLTNIHLHPIFENKMLNRQYAFVEFNSHRDAALAKKNITSGNNKLWDEEVTMEWAVMERKMDPHLLTIATKLFIRKYEFPFTVESVLNLLHEVISSHTVREVHVSGHYGFVNFINHEYAQFAKDKLSLTCINGEMIQVSWAKPNSLRKIVNNDKNSFKMTSDNAAQIEKNRRENLNLNTPLPQVYFPKLESNKQQHNVEEVAGSVSQNHSEPFHCQQGSLHQPYFGLYPPIMQFRGANNFRYQFPLQGNHFNPFPYYNH